MIIDGNMIYAEEGLVLRRKADKWIVGGSYSLGYTYYIGRKKLPEPKLEVPEDFEELTEEQDKQEKEKLYSILTVKYIREKYDLDAELAVQRQRNEKPEQFSEYYRFCEECKSRAKQDLGMD